MTTYTIELAQATDRKLADLHERAERTSSRLGRAADSIHYLAGDKQEYHERFGRGRWQKSLDECLAATPKPWEADTFARECAVVAECRAELATLRAAIEAEDAVHYWHQWPRFFLCLASDGHIHSSTHCSTCTYKTRFGWLPDLSGLDEAAAVAAHGAKLCTVCYPSAPVEYTNYFDAARAAKEASQCPGSGQYMERAARPVCPVCGKYGRRTPNGKVRAHRREA